MSDSEPTAGKDARTTACGGASPAPAASWGLALRKDEGSSRAGLEVEVSGWGWAWVGQVSWYLDMWVMAAPPVACGRWRLLDGVVRRYIEGNRNLGSEFGFG